MLDSDLDRQRNVFRITFAACILTALALIWSYRFLPLSDYPDWVFEGTVVAKLLRGKALASYSFKRYPVPYSGTVATLGLLDLILAPEISGKIVLSLSVILMALSSTYLLRSLRRDVANPLLLIPLLFLLNTFFFWESWPISSPSPSYSSTAATCSVDSIAHNQSIGGSSPPHR